MMTSSPGLTVQQSASTSPPLVPLVMSRLATVGLAESWLANIGEDSCTQFGDALGGGVAIPVLVDGRLGCRLDRRGDGKMRLADAEVDRVFQMSSEVEDLANAGHFDVLHPLRDPVLMHGPTSSA